MGRGNSSLKSDSTSVELAALREAIDKIGSQSAMARLLQVTQGSVSKWLSRGKPLPGEHVLAVEAATGVSKHRLRADIYGPDLTDAPKYAASGVGLEPAQ